MSRTWLASSPPTASGARDADPSLGGKGNAGLELRGRVDRDRALLSSYDHAHCTGVASLERVPALVRQANAEPVPNAPRRSPESVSEAPPAARIGPHRGEGAPPAAEVGLHLEQLSPRRERDAQDASLRRSGDVAVAARAVGADASDQMLGRALGSGGHVDPLPAERLTVGVQQPAADVQRAAEVRTGARYELYDAAADTPPLSVAAHHAVTDVHLREAR